MVKLLTIALVLALATATPAATHHRAIRHHAGRHHAASRHRRYTRLRPFSTEMKADSASNASAYRLASPTQAYLRPSLETRFGTKGGVASLGYQPGAVGQTLRPHELNGAAEPQLGHAESTAGVSVKVPL